MRVLTIGAKSAMNAALAQCDVCELVALEVQPPASPTGYRAMAYHRGSKLSFSSIHQVRRTIREVEPDIVHAFYPRPLAHTVLAVKSLRSRIPVVSFRGVTSVPKRWSPEQWISYHSPRVAAHACESAAVAEALVAAGIARERCHVVHNCLGGPLELMDRHEARRQLGLSDDAVIAMMVANLRRVKGADLLLRAAIECADLSNFHFALVGNVGDREVEQLASDSRLAGRVRLLGYREQASQFLSAADLFVMPSRAEALSVALLEAMTAGVCPVVSDAGGMKEAVRHEIDGLVFESENVAALSRAIRTLHDNSKIRRDYAASAKERATEQFSADSVAARIVGIYERLLGSR